METNTLILVGLLALSPSSTSTSLPNLCDDVHLDEDGTPIHDSTGQTLARYCELTGPDAPKWAAPVCCSFADGQSHCTEPSVTGACGSGQAQMWCDHGERMADRSVTCYQPLPDTCEAGFCIEAPDDVPQADMIPVCCFPDSGCWALQFEQWCGGFFTYCGDPYSLPNGSVGCGEDG